jgi:hypothetical protein
MISVILSEHSASLGFPIKAFCLRIGVCGTMRNKMSAASTEMTTSYQPTEQERGALEAHAGRIRKTPTSPRLKTWVKDNIPQMAVDHPSGGHGQALLMERWQQPTWTSWWAY